MVKRRIDFLTFTSNRNIRLTDLFIQEKRHGIQSQYILALEKYDITNKPQSNKIYEIIVSLQQISGPGIDEINLIDLLIYFAVSPTDPYKVAGYNHFLAEAMSKLDTYHRNRTSVLDSSIVQSIPVTPVVLSSLSPNATPFCPRAEVCFPKETGCDGELEANLKVKYLELILILGASTSTSFDKHYKQKLTVRYLDYTNNVEGALDNL